MDLFLFPWAIHFTTCPSESVLSLTLSVSGLSAGWHTLTADVTCGNISRSVTRTFYVSADGIVAGSDNLAGGKFSDVPVSSWCYKYVESVYKQGLFSGTGETIFEPNANMTRAMFVTVLGRLAEQMGENVSGYTSGFNDVKSGTWYTSYVAWATANGIVNGYDSNTFGTNDSVTREQMMTILVRFAEYMNITLDSSTSYSFTDMDSVSAWAKSAITKAAAAGLIAGYTDGTLKPQGTATRAEVAAVFYRFSAAYK